MRPNVLAKKSNKNMQAICARFRYQLRWFQILFLFSRLTQITSWYPDPNLIDLNFGVKSNHLQLVLEVQLLHSFQEFPKKKPDILFSSNRQLKKSNKQTLKHHLHQMYQKNIKWKSLEISEIATYNRSFQTLVTNNSSISSFSLKKESKSF